MYPVSCVEQISFNFNEIILRNSVSDVGNGKTENTLFETCKHANCNGWNNEMREKH